MGPLSSPPLHPLAAHVGSPVTPGAPTHRSQSCWPCAMIRRSHWTCSAKALDWVVRPLQGQGLCCCRVTMQKPLNSHWFPNGLKLVTPKQGPNFGQLTIDTSALYGYVLDTVSPSANEMQDNFESAWRTGHAKGVCLGAQLPGCTTLVEKEHTAFGLTLFRKHGSKQKGI